jgi:superfamily II DNA/RNA helicase
VSLQVLQNWLESESGIKNQLNQLRIWSARKSIVSSLQNIVDTDQDHDWQKLLLAASIFSQSDDKRHQEYALMIAQSALCFSDESSIRDAGSLILARLSNHRTINLAQEQHLIEPNLGTRVGVIEQLLWNKRKLNSEIVFNEKHSISGNLFQVDLWSKLSDADWLSATAPTAAGKTFTILNWLLSQFASKKCHSAVFVAPTRALVTEIERQLNELKLDHNLNSLKITSLPLRELSGRKEPFISVFTQERLHIFLNSGSSPQKFDIAIIDEAQKLSDERRGVILQDALERLCRENNKCKVVFLSPHSQNPEVLLEDAPENVITAVVSSASSTVMQNLIVAEQIPRKPTEWKLSLSIEGELNELGSFKLIDRPTNAAKRLAFVALALGKSTTGTLVYVNTASTAEKIATLIYDGLDDIDLSEDSELSELSESCKKIIHSKFQLVKLVKRGVAFHYGNMPSILREEIERLFTLGKIKFLVSTSTLIEGVNIACKTIVVRGPKKGIMHHMSPQDFWNLAGRAGRWGADFYGNIVCVDVSKADVWPYGLPQKTAYPIKRETDTVIQQYDDLVEYITNRPAMDTNDLDHKLEHVTAYLMSWQIREGSLKDASPIKKISPEAAQNIEELVQPLLESIDVESKIISANPGISVIALQRLLEFFRNHSEDIESLLPLPPEDPDSVDQFVFIFDVINLTLAPVFAPQQRVLPCALTTWDWMRGKTLGRMIAARLDRERKTGSYESDEELPYAKLIRETMSQVEEIARFYAPKYLGAYLSVLRQHFVEKDQIDMFPDELTYDLFLEFGVSTKTLISLIGLGLSRTSSIELAEYYGRSEMSEEDVLTRLHSGEWESLDLPPLVKREIRNIVKQKILEGM